MEKGLGDSGADLGAPHELVADGGEEVLGVHADEADVEGGAAEGYLGGTREGEAARVHAESEALGDGDEAQARVVGHDDGAQGEGVGTDGCDDEASAVGREDGASAGERIGRGARGRGHDDAVAGIGGHV